MCFIYLEQYVFYLPRAICVLFTYNNMCFIYLEQYVFYLPTTICVLFT